MRDRLEHQGPTRRPVGCRVHCRALLRLSAGRQMDSLVHHLEPLTGKGSVARPGMGTRVLQFEESHSHLFAFSLRPLVLIDV